MKTKKRYGLRIELDSGVGYMWERFSIPQCPF